MNVNNKVKNKGIESAIKKIGSLHKVATLCNVTAPCVFKWLYSQCPPERAVQIETLTGVRRELIRPDIFLVK